MDPQLTGTWGIPDHRGLPSIVFDPDSAPNAARAVGNTNTSTDSDSDERTGITRGSYAGSDGCNRIAGSYTFARADGTIDLGAMISTMMYCEGVDTWLSRARTARLTPNADSDAGADGSRLVFFDEAGAQIGSLSRP